MQFCLYFCQWWQFPHTCHLKNFHFQNKSTGKCSISETVQSRQIPTRRKTFCFLLQKKKMSLQSMRIFHVLCFKDKYIFIRHGSSSETMNAFHVGLFSFHIALQGSCKLSMIKLEEVHVTTIPIQEWTRILHSVQPPGVIARPKSHIRNVFPVVSKSQMQSQLRPSIEKCSNF